MRERYRADEIRSWFLASVVFLCTAWAPLPASGQQLLYLWDQTSLGHGLSCYRIAIDHDGNAHLPQFNGYGVDMLGTPAGPWLGSWIPTGIGSLSNPRGIAVASNGDLYVVDRGHYRIAQFTSTGVFVRAWGSAGSDSTQFEYPEDIAIGVGDTVFVSDNGQARIKVFTSSGNFVRQFGSAGNGTAYFGGGTSGPWGIAVDGQGHVFATDESNAYGGRVKEFTTTGEFVRAWGTAGSQDGQFTANARAIAVDRNGHVYVAEAGGARRVQVFTNEGVFLRSWALPLLRNGATTSASGMCVDASGRVYVVSFASSVQVFSTPLVDAASSPPAAELMFASPEPNPSPATTTLRFALPRASNAELELCDAAGRRVASWHWRALGPGMHEVIWNGRTSTGRKVPAGVYFSRLAVDGRALTRRFVRL